MVDESFPGRRLSDVLYETMLLCKVPADIIDKAMKLADKKAMQRRIMLSDDDEGNGYHTMFYVYTDSPSMNESIIQQGLLHDRADWSPEDFVILG